MIHSHPLHPFLHGSFVKWSTLGESRLLQEKKSVFVLLLKLYCSKTNRLWTAEEVTDFVMSPLLHSPLGPWVLRKDEVGLHQLFTKHMGVSSHPRNLVGTPGVWHPCGIVRSTDLRRYSGRCPLDGDPPELLGFPGVFREDPIHSSQTYWVLVISGTLRGTLRTLDCKDIVEIFGVTSPMTVPRVNGSPSGTEDSVD